MKRVYDLSHLLSDCTPVYPGDKAPEFSLNEDLLKSNIFVTNININTHLGTHLDCPSHLGDKKVFASDINLENCIGRAIVLDTRNHISNNQIQRSILTEKHFDYEFILFYTGHDTFWGNEEYFYNAPYLSNELVVDIEKSKVKGIGIDCANVDEINNLNFTNHHLLLSSGKIIVENLTNMKNLIGKEFTFMALPLKIKYGDGSPIRAIAIID
jgi:kynurenine formamidase